MAKNAFYSQKFDQAIHLLQQLLNERPTDFSSRILLIEGLQRPDASNPLRN